MAPGAGGRHRARALRPGGVKVSPPSFGQITGLGERVEDFAVEQFIAQRSVEALAISILPWRSGRDVQRFHADLGEPSLQDPSRQTLESGEIGKIIRQIQSGLAVTESQLPVFPT